MPTAESLLVRIDATTEQLRRELRRGDQAVGDFSNKVNSRLAGIDKSFSGLSAGIGKINGLIGALGVGVGIGALVNLGRSALNLADDLQDTAAQLGVSTEALQVFRFAAAETGVQAGQLDQAILKLTNTIGEAASGDEAAQKKFKALGIAFEDSSKKARTAEPVLADLANLVQSLVSPAERAAAAGTLMGDRMGPRLVPLLADGAEGLRDYGQAAKDAGQILEDDTLATLAKAQREIEKFTNSLTIAAGNVIAFFSEASKVDEQFGLDRQIARTVQRIDELREAINLAKAGGGGIFSGLEDVPELEAEMQRLIQLRNELFGRLDSKPQGHAGRGILFPPTKPAGTLNLGDDSDAEAAAKKIEAAIDSVRLKIAQAEADFADDPLGKALAENFARAGLSIDDFSAKAEELRVLTELQVDAETNLAIATEGLTAAREADREAVAEWTKVQDEGKQVMEDLRTPTEEYAATVERLNFLLKEGAIDSATWARALEKAGKDLEDADEKTKALKDSMEDASHVIGTSFEDAILKGERLRDVLQGLLEDIGRIILRLTVTKPLEGLIGDTLGGLLGGLFSSASAGPALSTGGALSIGSLGSLLPFATGGSFKVGGSGGTDSKAIAFRATPGELVNVSRPGQQGGGVVINMGGIVVNSAAGTPEQNQDFASRLGSEMKIAIRGAVEQQIERMQRANGRLNPA
jgi:hypothetical protein